MHGVGFSGTRGVDFIHTALFHEIGSGCSLSASNPYQGLDEHTLLLLMFTFTSLRPFLLYPLSGTGCG